jgi:hypothetical protein
MELAEDAGRVAASLADWLDALTFVDQGADQVTALLADSVAAWAAGQGWRVYPRAPSVMTLPAPFSHRHSFLDVACARPEGAPVAVEIDRADRRRTVDKLLAEAAAGRVAIWLRWGGSRFEPPPLPVRMVTFRVTTRRGLAGGERLHSRLPASDRPAPTHSAGAVAGSEQAGLFGEPR